MVVDTPTREEIHSVIESYRTLSKGKRSRMTLADYLRQELSEAHSDTQIRRGDDMKNLIDHIVEDLESYG